MSAETTVTRPYEAPAATALPIASGDDTWALLRELVGQRRGLAVASVLAMLAATSVGLLTQPLLGRMVDIVADGRAASALTVPAILIGAVAIGQGVLTWWGMGLVARLGESTLATLRERFIGRALHLPLAQVEGAGSGDLTSRVTNDVSVVGDSVREALPEFARAVLAIALTVAAIAVLDWRFALAALIAVPIQAFTVRWYVRRAGPLYAQQRVAVGEQQQQLLETVGGAATVRAHRMAGQRLDLLTARSERTVGISLRGIRLVTTFFARLNVAEWLGLSAVLVVGYLLVGNGVVSIGTATAAALYFHSLFTPINTALVLVDDAYSAAASLTRLAGVASLVDQAPAVVDQAVVDGDEHCAIRVQQVSHSYGAADVLRDVDLDIRWGQRIALVGASGAGKTTLATLIAGIHTPVRGSIEVGGEVALVTQEVHVFSGPLIDDLRLARASASDEEVRAALELVEALTWALALPEGLDTVVGDGGHRLSAAQSQQLALARLVLADPPIAILDEATAEAGSAGARLLERAALRALDGRTSLVVAHRLTQAATADLIVVLDAGAVVEQGTHAELLAAGGRYAELWQAWSPGT